MSPLAGRHQMAGTLLTEIEEHSLPTVSVIHVFVYTPPPDEISKEIHLVSVFHRPCAFDLITK